MRSRRPAARSGVRDLSAGRYIRTSAHLRTGARCQADFHLYGEQASEQRGEFCISLATYTRARTHTLITDSTIFRRSDNFDTATTVSASVLLTCGCCGRRGWSVAREFVLAE